jgi:hypothetical protein
MLENCQKDASLFVKIQNELKDLEKIPHKICSSQQIAVNMIHALWRQFNIQKQKRQFRMALFFFFKSE